MDSLTSNQKNAFYTFMVIRLCVYSYFVAVNGYQSAWEIKNFMKKKQVNTRFFVFFSYMIFCMFRVACCCRFFDRPDEYLVGTWYYFLFSWSVVFVMTAWCSISSFWMQLFYTFFVTEDVRSGHVKRILVIAYSLAVAFFIYEVPVTIICLERDISTAEAIGFIVFLVLFFLQIGVNGMILIKSLKNHQKKSRFANFDHMIFKTKILMATIVISVVVILAHDIVFNFAITPEYWHFPLSSLITGVIEVGQMVSVLLVLSNGDYKSYILFRRIRNIASQGSEGPSSSKESSKGNAGNSSSKVNSKSMASNSKSSDSETDSSISIDVSPDKSMSVELSNIETEKENSI
ncbi:hypothetical protein DLAC_00240 [Tieghemostelium lacteum]|uniref:THH1/TOM1/TOM3 domain-containing protein n=1 Tax=Tieghemostelium lacteum TaxID=361077 RepID=A0A152A981_TIELA|nr:hypothetical protein DLAC_00240 [Tieghemostelium lacteum]|eukprot:KYR02778.1 hypothetical protein DLAC_00240 [Tieghemostelium lacteum]